METKATAVEMMSPDELSNLKCGNCEKFDIGKSMQGILKVAATQLKTYMKSLKALDQARGKEFDIVGFAVLMVGSRRFLWKCVSL